MSCGTTIPLHSPVSIDYLDSKGVLTRRTIVPLHRCVRRGGEYLIAFCCLRGEERTFRTDRICAWTKEHDSAALIPSIDKPITEKPALPHSSIRTSAASSTFKLPETKPVRKSSWAGVIFCMLFYLAATILLGVFAKQKHTPVPAKYTVPITVPAAVTNPVEHAEKTAPIAEETPSPKTEERGCYECGDRFRSATKIDSPALEAIYAAADYNRDGSLSWREIQIFQNWMKDRFAYRSNELALPPDRFLSEGGGDCEDWALFTCGMLRYWGWEAYLGSAGAARQRRNSVGHAFTFIRVDDVPQGFEWFEVTRGGLNYAVAPGKYVPVDYEVVGGYSSAVRRRWVIDGISSPERNYNVRM